VLLNACYSRVQAEAITEVIDCVIGMNDAIGDNCRCHFAAHFIAALILRSFQEAFSIKEDTHCYWKAIRREYTELLLKTGIDQPRISYRKTMKDEAKDTQAGGGRQF